MEKAAHGWLMSCSPSERAQVPRRGKERWVSLMREAELLRLPAAFREFDAFSLSADGRLVTATRWLDKTAVCSRVMRAGWHYAQFTLVEGDFMMLGVIRPTWDVVSRLHAQEQARHCFFHTGSGQRFPGVRPAKRKWAGMARAAKGDRIGLLLDLDEGSMAVYKNDRWLGVMKKSGLRGEYCWTAILQLALPRQATALGSTLCSCHPPLTPRVCRHDVLSKKSSSSDESIQFSPSQYGCMLTCNRFSAQTSAT